MESIGHIEDPVFIHFEFDNWQPGNLYRSTEDHNIWYCYRRVPPGPHRYFFTVLGVAKIADNHPKVKSKFPVKTDLINFKVFDEFEEERWQ